VCERCVTFFAESDALLDVYNEGTSISSIGFLDNNAGMWLTTDMGGVSVWNVDTAERIRTHEHIAQAVNAQWALGCLGGGRVACGHTDGNVSVVSAEVLQVTEIVFEMCLKCGSIIKLFIRSSACCKEDILVLCVHVWSAPMLVD
jgi:hypothetical protein